MSTASVPSFVRRLRALVPTPVAGFNSHARHLFCYCSLDRERIAAIRMAHPSIVIVLQGSKEVWVGDHVQVFAAGSVFVLPGGLALDVVNIPGTTGACVYEAMIVEVPGLPAGVPPLTPEERSLSITAPVFGITPGEDLIEALVHAATAIADGRQGETLKALRLAEVLTLMRLFPAARPLFAASVSDNVAWLIRGAPAETWTVAGVAAQLGLGASTLRRQLAEAGTSFRAILARERLKVGRDALEAGALSVAAADAAGYASRSHFSRRYRQHFGTSPTGRA